MPPRYPTSNPSATGPDAAAAGELARRAEHARRAIDCSADDAPAAPAAGGRGAGRPVTDGAAVAARSRVVRR